MDEAIAVGSVNRGVPFTGDPRVKSAPLVQTVFQLADRLVAEVEPVEMPAPAPERTAGKKAEDATRERLGRIFNRG
jgi:hypothetical protein